MKCVPNPPKVAAGTPLGKAYYGGGWDIYSLLPTHDATAGETLDHIASLLDVQIEANERALIIEYMTTVRSDAGEDTRIVWDATSVWHASGWSVFDKLQGIVHLLKVDEDFQLR